jgi:hypothetical protein
LNATTIFPTPLDWSGKSQNWSASVPAIDFTTALARLLQEGLLRDEFATQPELALKRLNLCEPDRVALLALNAADLEFQAQILLRKRLDAVRHVIPETCQRLREQTWRLFAEYARNFWPKSIPFAAADAYAFCAHLQATQSGIVSALEWNRLRFAFSQRRFDAHLLRPDARQSRTAVQILFRFRPCRWRELRLYLKF